MSARPRLLVITSTLPRFSGDPEPAFVQHLATALSDRFDITLLAPMDALARKDELIESGVRVRRYRYAPLRRWETLAYPGGIMPRLRAQPWRWVQVPMLLAGLIWAIWQLQREQRAALIHCHWLLPQGLAALLVQILGQKTPVVVTSHGGDLHTLARGASAPLLRWVLRRAAGVTVVSPHLSTLVQDFLGYLPNNTAVVPMGVELEKFRCARPPTAGKPAELLFVGRLAEKKGLSYLLQAMADPRVQAIDCTLSVIGDGPLRAALQAQAVSLGVQNKVRFLGATPYAKVPAAMENADILIAPSVRAADGDCEGLPTVILEAMAAGLVVVATPNGGISQLVRDNQTGLLVAERDVSALADALLALLHQPELRQQLAHAAMQEVQQYDWEKIATRYAQVFDRALAPQNHQKITT